MSVKIRHILPLEKKFGYSIEFASGKVWLAPLSTFRQTTERTRGIFRFEKGDGNVFWVFFFLFFITLRVHGVIEV